MWASTASAGPAEAPPNRVLLYYALPGLVTAIPTIPVFTLVPGYYSGEMGLGLALTGLVLFISRALDLVSDPLAGWISLRFNEVQPMKNIQGSDLIPPISRTHS